MTRFLLFSSVACCLAGAALGQRLTTVSRPSAQIATVRIDGYDAGRTDNLWGLTEDYFTGTRALLTDPTQFGEGGVVEAEMVIGAGISVATADSLADVDIFITGWIPTSSYTAAEKQVLLDFVLGGGCLIATTDDLLHNMVDVFGVTHGGHVSANPLDNVITNPTHPLADGPFGTVETFQQYFSCGRYADLGPHALEVGRNFNGVSLAVIEAGALAPGSGRVVLVADVDVFTTHPQQVPDPASTVNATLIKNIFAWCLEDSSSECFVLDFETEDDFVTPLVNGQHIDTEFGNHVLITSTGPNAGPCIFDSTVGGPNAVSQDPDLLFDTGNVLILQTPNFPPDGNDVFPAPNDAENGGTLAFVFNEPAEAVSVRLLDVDSSDSDWRVVLTDGAGRRRIYDVPSDWTGDLIGAGPGQGTLDLTHLAPQPGFAAVATAAQDAGFDARGVVRIDVDLGGSGAVDDLCVCLSSGVAPRAAVEPRNGSGFNLENLSCAALPVLGGTFAASLDCTQTGPGLAVLEVRRLPSQGTMTVEGEVLTRGPLVYRKVRAHSGTASLLTWDVPADTALAGLTMYAQGLCRGAVPGSGRLFQFHDRMSNALDLMLGF